MKISINPLIDRWRSYRNFKMLESRFSAKYAFVGIGSHALQNLYPVISYLGIPLKYICCTNEKKLPLIERKFPYGVIATTSLDTVLSDREVEGVFVCTSPQTHYSLAKEVLASGKYLFVEKPPCQTLSQLENLIAIPRTKNVLVGMQKRYSPLTQRLKREISANRPISYQLFYQTGKYPEGDSVMDLFIHPIDMACFLFGKACISGIQRIEKNGAVTIQLLLKHGEVLGQIELSTFYSWSCPAERISVNTAAGEYVLDRMECLSFNPHARSLCGMPLEKVGMFTPSLRMLERRNNFNPLAVNNQLYTQGFYSEIAAFGDLVEHSGKSLSDFESLVDTYTLLSQL